MLNEIIKKKTLLEYENLILAIDMDKLTMKTEISEMIRNHGFSIVEYSDVEDFRYKFESEIKESEDQKYFVIVNKDIYLPYDVREFFYVVSIKKEVLFSKLDYSVLSSKRKIDLDLLSIAYDHLYKEKLTSTETDAFLEVDIYGDDYIQEYIEKKKHMIKILLNGNISYETWFTIAEIEASMKRMLLKTNNEFKVDAIEQLISEAFSNFLISNYNSLANRSYFKHPVMLNKVIEYILLNHEKVALIVMDGMSVLDWQIIDEQLEVSAYTNYSFALIPTITSISRQSLLSGKLPVEHTKPFSLSNEKKQFIENLVDHGYKKETIKYHRGYDFDIYRTDKFITTIVNDIDDLVHNQIQGVKGLYRDIKMLADSDKLNKLINRLKNEGFDIFITSDHGNRSTIGICKPKGLGIEVETKSQRMIINKEYADSDTLMDQFMLKEFESNYLPNDFKYLICDDNSSIGKKGENIISHGGISLNEVIVPFIRVEGDIDE